MTPFSYEALYRPRRVWPVVVGCLAQAALGGCAASGISNLKSQISKGEARPSAAAVTVAPVRAVTLAWDPYTNPEAHLVLAHSADLQHWAVVTNLPWWVSNTVVAATGQCGFYRLGADWN